MYKRQDHDNIKAFSEAKIAGEALDITVVPGCLLYTSYRGKHKCRKKQRQAIKADIDFILSSDMVIQYDSVMELSLIHI